MTREEILNALSEAKGALEGCLPAVDGEAFALLESAIGQIGRAELEVEEER